MVMSNEESWWVIHGSEIKDALERVAKGDHPEVVWTELNAGSKTERFPGNTTPVEEIDTSTWRARHVVVPVDRLRVRQVEHEVVEWEASFSSEDCFSLEEIAGLGDGEDPWAPADE